MSRLPTLLTAALGSLLIGCSGESLPPTPADQPIHLASHNFTAPVTQGDSLALVLDVARHLALSLGDEQTRSELARALKRTTVSEGKLHLQRFLGRGRALQT